MSTVTAIALYCQHLLQSSVIKSGSAMLQVHLPVSTCMPQMSYQHHLSSSCDSLHQIPCTLRQNCPLETNDFATNAPSYGVLHCVSSC